MRQDYEEQHQQQKKPTRTSKCQQIWSTSSSASPVDQQRWFADNISRQQASRYGDNSMSDSWFQQELEESVISHDFSNQHSISTTSKSLSHNGNMKSTDLRQTTNHHYQTQSKLPSCSTRPKVHYSNIYNYKQVQTQHTQSPPLRGGDLSKCKLQFLQLWA